MGKSLNEELENRLSTLQEKNLFRKLQTVTSPQQPFVSIGGRELINFSSNDYLGLANHPKLKAAAMAALERYGTGSGASRLISGSLEPHQQLEEALAVFKRTERAIAFSSGYAAALGTITALVGRGDVVVLDKLVHASIVDAARLSGATLRVFRHNDLNDLEEILKWADQQRCQNSQAAILIVTESLFSMDGDVAPLGGLVELKDRFGAWLMVDEAHATGLFGLTRRGLAEEVGVSDRIEVQMGTLGKAIGSAGGFIAGSRVLIEYLINKARSFIFSTAPAPSVSAAARAGIELIESEEGAVLLQRLRQHIGALRAKGLTQGAPHSPILPLVVGKEECALELASSLRERGMFVPAIRYPTVARGKARLRFTLSSAHSEAEIKRLIELLSVSNILQRST